MIHLGMPLRLKILRLAGVALLLCQGLQCVEADDGIELLESACKEALHGSIRTGEFRYTCRFEEAEVSSKKTASDIQASFARRFEKMLEKTNDPKIKAEIERMRSFNTIESHQQQVEKSHHRLTAFVYIMQHPEYGGDRYIEFSRLDPKTGGPLPGSELDKNSAMLMRTYEAAASQSLALHTAMGMATTNVKFYPGTQEPNRFGRINGILYSSLRGIAADKLRTAVESMASEISVTSIPGTTTKELSCLLRPAGKDFAVRVRYHIDPDRGYVVPMIEESSEDGKLMSTWTCSDYFQNPDGLYFPGKCAYRYFQTRGTGSDAASEPVRTETYEFTRDGVILNSPMSPDRFKVEIPIGTQVMDGQNQPLVARETVTLSLDDLPRLSQVRGLAKPKTGDSNSTHVNAKHQQRRLIIGVNIVAVLLLSFFFWRRRSRGGNRGVMGLLIALLAGCGDTTGANNPANLECISISPSEIRLGESVAGRDLHFDFEIKNHTTSDLVVDVIPSCGCTVLEQGHIKVSPLSHSKTEMTMSTRGRAGQFRTHIAFIARDGKSGDRLSRSEVPITAEFCSGWTASPRRIVLPAEVGASSTISLTGESSEWEGVDVVWPGESIAHEQTSISIVGKLETRVFRVSVLRNDASGSSMSLVRDGSTRPLFTVPILISASSKP